MPNGDSPKKSWLAVEFQVDAAQEDLASWLMVQCGSRGCQVIPAGSSEVVIQANFDRCDGAEPDIEKLKSELEMYGLASCLNTLKSRVIPEEDWLAEWKKGFEPFPVGESFLITPPWSLDDLTSAQIAGRHVLIIEPGLAFGTGLHETTQYCLRQIEYLPLGQDIADIGTGSGILAMAAARVSLDSKIIGVEIDPDALRVAQENLELNELADRIQLIEGSTEVLPNLSVDTLLSNLTCEDIIALLLEYLRILRPDGSIICSGILSEKLPLLESAIETYPLTILHQEVGEKWAGVTLGRIGVVIGSA